MKAPFGRMTDESKRLDSSVILLFEQAYRVLGNGAGKEVHPGAGTGPVVAAPNVQGGPEMLARAHHDLADGRTPFQ